MSRRCDVVVVGGGPAGSVTALLLARRGWDVTLLDRAFFPRAKPCGECVNPGAVAALHRLGLLERVLSLPHAPLQGWTIRTPGGEATGTFGGSLHGLGISRMRLDAELLDAARNGGVTVREGVRVTAATAAAPGSCASVEVAEGGTRRTLHTSVVVGADGLRSVVARSLRLVRRVPRLRKISLTAHVGGIDLSVERGLLVVDDGCTVGVAPLGDGTRNVTVVVPAGSPEMDRLRADPMAFLLASMRSRLPEAHRAAALGGPWASGPFDWPVRRPWAPGIALVGDAAGYFDPFTGQGIFRALRSAELASSAVHRVLLEGRGDTDPWAPLDAYGRRWRRELRWRGLMQRGVEAILARPALRDRVLPALGTTGALDGVVRFTGDVARPADVPGASGPRHPVRR